MTAFEDYISSLQRFGIQPGLERIQALLQRMGQPHLQYPHILVGGTNGKGSTCEFLARLLAANGHEIGLYTSPHLYRWNERVRIVGEKQQEEGSRFFPDAITDKDLDALLDEAKPDLEAVARDLGQPTEFETITALALWHFARSGIETAVLEVGLGGRWDATNVTEPLVSVITHVALDHCDRLGNTLEEIARDKVEIIRQDRVLVTAETKPSVLEIFARQCEANRVKFQPIFAPDWSNDRDNLLSVLDYLQAASQPNEEFQRANWQTALAAYYAFRQQQGQLVTPPNSEFSFQVPGRLEVVQENPRVVLDVCNNPDGAAYLVRAFQERFPDAQGRTILVLGILADKDYDAMTRLLAPLARVVIATQSQSPRAAHATSIATLARPFCSEVITVLPVTDAMKYAIEIAEPSDTILVAGSFTNISETMSCLNEVVT
jgi:dihydrofolate synthase/folylpolyglutamate synthase